MQQIWEVLVRQNNSARSSVNRESFNGEMYRNVWYRITLQAGEA